MVNRDITEDFQYDFNPTQVEQAFSLTDIAYDVTINNLPFVIKSDNQNPYRRETAPYKKEQFDNSTEPGEQSLTGWWLRSQTSWHTGAGITFYEPGSDNNSKHRFFDSRGVDVWTVGEATLLPKVFQAYSDIKGINAATGQYDKTVGTEIVPTEVLVAGDNDGILKRIELNNNSAVIQANYTAGATFPDGHNGNDHPFYSVATDGSTYYAVCDSAVHKGTIGTLTSDDIYFRYTSSTSTNAFVKYAKGFMLFAQNNRLGVMSTDETPSTATHTTGTVHGFSSTDDFISNYTTHINTSWKWKDVTASPGPIYLAGNGGNNGEVWKVTIDETTNNLNMAGATMSLSLPDGELVNTIHYYLGFLAVGTNKGIRICQINSNNDLIMGPLLFDTNYSVNAFTERGSYLYAATKVLEGGFTNGVLVRIDLSQQFEDGTFAYAYDLEYESYLDSDNSDCTEVYNIQNRLVMVIQENSNIIKGELQVEHTSNKRTTGYLETGKIRYATVEPKTFRLINVNADTEDDSFITVSTVLQNGNVFPLIDLKSSVTGGSDISIKTPNEPVEFLSIKFTLNSSSSFLSSPKLNSYQIKSIPVVKKQRLTQYSLQCYDNEMDKFNTSFGYTGRAYELLSNLEKLEELSEFVLVKDYRTGEAYEGIIEEVRFTNESSPDKNNSGFGGLLLVTVRKL